MLALGSNLDPRGRWLDHARETLHELGAVELASTPRWNTLPVGGPPQPDFLNQMLLVQGRWDGWGWLRVAQLAEIRAGRVRSVDKGPRRLDVDVILVAGVAISSPELSIPHRALLDRPFLLAGAAALVPHWTPPGWHATIGELASARLRRAWARPVPVREVADRPGMELL
ncbi:MAG: 2-amino-4-hydroxy-6-hydroxymethyldihydropteridine diphosphokinase [Candidatus Dormibacteraeota bacterium]|nr:2-amino-4-hydroxy-6-hydroxymethyldihydropteridine diphosphokinase [Candidatus Dormibacteraeota bacterium]